MEAGLTNFMFSYTSKVEWIFYYLGKAPVQHWASHLLLGISSNYLKENTLKGKKGEWGEKTFVIFISFSPNFSSKI